MHFYSYRPSTESKEGNVLSVKRGYPLGHSLIKYTVKSGGGSTPGPVPGPI